MLLQNLIVGRAGNLSRFARHWQLRPVVHVGVFLPSARAMAETDDTPPVGNRRFRVYTRTGDKGQSSLYNGERRNKDDAVFEALGDVDELNAHVGVAREHVAASNMGFEDQLVWIQSRLLDVGSAIATPPDRARPEVLAKVAFPIIHSEQLEHWIDAMDDQLPQLTNFILPSGGLASAQLHVARTVCRRAERAAVHLVHAGVLPSTAPAAPSAQATPVEGSTSPAPSPSLPVGAAGHPVTVFLNRLSDYLFVAARYACMLSGHDEQVYKKANGLVVRGFTAKSPSAAAPAPTA